MNRTISILAVLLVFLTACSRESDSEKANKAMKENGDVISYLNTDFLPDSRSKNASELLRNLEDGHPFKTNIHVLKSGASSINTLSYNGKQYTYINTVKEFGDIGTVTCKEIEKGGLISLSKCNTKGNKGQMIVLPMTTSDLRKAEAEL